VHRGENIPVTSTSGFGITQWEVYSGDDNVALDASITSTHTWGWAPAGQTGPGFDNVSNYERIIDGNIEGAHWNTHNSGAGQATAYAFNDGRAFITLTWAAAQTLVSTRVMWWSDQPTGHGSGVPAPERATVQWLDGDTWRNVNADAASSRLGVDTGRPEGHAGRWDTSPWNELEFDAPITTRSLRLEVFRGDGISVFGNDGFGIVQWEVYAGEGGAPAGDVPAEGLHFTMGSLNYVLDGATLTGLQAPFLSADDRVMVPLRVAASALGAADSDIVWDGATNTASITIGARSASVTLGQALPDNLGTPVNIDGTIFVPLRFVTVALHPDASLGFENNVASITW
jgi:hypothetical protein